MDHTNDNGDIRVPRPLKILGKTLKWFLISTVSLMILWVALCGIFQKGTPSMKKYVFTGDTAKIYAEKGELTVFDLTAYNVSSLDKVFYIENIMYTEETKEFQFMLRYNTQNEIAKDILAKYEDGEEPFAFAIKDNKGTTYTEYKYFTSSALMYKYYRVVFSNVDTSAATEMSVKIYENSDNIDPHVTVDSCILWYSDGYKTEHKLTSSEKKNVMNDNDLIARSLIFIPEEADENQESGE